MSSEFTQDLMTLASGKDQENNVQRDLKMRKRKRKVTDVAGSSRKKIQGRGNMTHSTDPCNKVQEDVSVRKRRAGEDGEMPGKRMRCSNLTNSTEHSEASVEDFRIQKGKRKASVDARPPEKKARCSINNTNTTDPSAVLVVNCWSGKRKADHDAETPKKRGRCSDTDTNTTEPSLRIVEDPQVEMKKRKASDVGEAPEKRMRCSASTSSTDSSVEVMEDVRSDDDGVDVSQNFSASAEEEKIYELSSSGNTSRAEFEDKYHQLAPIGAGGFGSVYGGFRKSDSLPVAIKHIPSKDVSCERVICNGKVFNIILEVAFMLKAGGLPGSVGQSAAVSLLDWYIVDHELILVMERPVDSMDLHKYLQTHGGSLDEREAKEILRQLVDAAIDMHSKGVFHRDIKLQNVLVQSDSGVPRVRVIDFGCGSFSTEMSYSSFCGTCAYYPPEWFEYGTYWARLTTVWQLGALFYSLLSGHERFTTTAFINNHIQINSALSAEVKTLLHMCLARDPAERATLEELQLKLVPWDNPALYLPKATSVSKTFW